MYSKKDCFKIYKLARDDKLIFSDKYKELWPNSILLHNLLNDVTDDKIIPDCVNRTIELLDKYKDRKNDIDIMLIGVCTNTESPLTRLDMIKAILTPQELINEDPNYGLGYYLTLSRKIAYEMIRYNQFYNFNYQKFNELSKYLKNTDQYSVLENDLVSFTILASIYANDKDYSIMDEYLTYPKYYNDYLVSINILQRSRFNHDNNHYDSYNYMFENLFYNVDVILNKHKKPIK